MEPQHGIEEDAERRARPGASRGASPVPATDQERERQLVLMVEDDPNELEMYGRILWYNGFDVLYARDGAEGLKFARTRQPDLVLLDLGLPEMDGLEVCRRIREESPGAAPAVLILTARGERAYGERAVTAGCDGYLEKPHSPLKVLHEVEALIGRAPPGAEGHPPEVRSRDA